MREEPKGAAAIVPNVLSSLSNAGSAPAGAQYMIRVNPLGYQNVIGPT